MPRPLSAYFDFHQRVSRVNSIAWVWRAKGLRLPSILASIKLSVVSTCLRRNFPIHATVSVRSYIYYRRLRLRGGRSSAITRQEDASNFFLEAKGPDGSLVVAQRQACHDSAIGARAIQSLQSYRQEEPVYDGNASAVSSTYHGGATAFKNAIDLTEEYRNAVITQGSERASQTIGDEERCEDEHEAEAKDDVEEDGEEAE